MTNALFHQIVNSFHFNEKKDFEAVCSILDKKVNGKKLISDVVVIHNDPYLLVLIFLCLIRHLGIRIHILNPNEGIDELSRLLGIINPDVLINSDVINGETLSKESRYDIDYSGELDFTVTTYTPYPTKIHNISSELLSAMLNAFVSDIYKFDLMGDHDYGCIPFTSDNPDYLFYMLALRLVSKDMILPSACDVDLPIRNKKVYKLHNKAKTLFIPKKEFQELYFDKIISIFEIPFIFRVYLKHRWLINILIKRRLNRLFKGFTNVLIIGILDNMYTIELLKNLSIKFYTIFPIASALQFGSISKSFITVLPIGNETKMEIFRPHKERFILTINLFADSKTVYNLVNKDLLFQRSTIHENSQNRYEYEVIGSIDNMFVNKGAYIFPEQLEKVINSNPLIKNCTLLTFNQKMTLVINPNMNILDSVRINQGMFHRVIQQQIDMLNEKLPDEYKIRGFVVGTSLIEQDRLGDLCRSPFNTINKM